MEGSYEMSEGGSSLEIAKNIGIIASLVGFIGTAIKVGNWKGEHEVRIKNLESVLEATVDKLSNMNDRLNGIDKELLRNMTELKKDVEYIKKTIETNVERRRNAPEK
jgi:hypothetical protein